MITINYNKTIKELINSCISLEGEGNFESWKISAGLNVEPLHRRVELLEDHLKGLSENQVSDLLNERRDDIMRAFSSVCFPGGTVASELINELAEIENELSK